MRSALLFALLALPARAADPYDEREAQLGQAHAQASRLIEDVEAQLQRLGAARARYEQGKGGAKAFEAWESERRQVLGLLDPGLDSLGKVRKTLIEMRESAAMTAFMSFAGGLKAKDGSAMEPGQRFVKNIQYQPIERDANECLMKAERVLADDAAAFAAEAQRLSAQRRLVGRSLAGGALAAFALLGWLWRRSTRAGTSASPGSA